MFSGSRVIDPGHTIFIFAFPCVFYLRRWRWTMILLICMICLILKITSITRIRRITVQTMIFSNINKGRPRVAPTNASTKGNHIGSPLRNAGNPGLET